MRPPAARDAPMAPRKDTSGNARFSAPRTLRLLRQRRHRDTSSRRTRRVRGARLAPYARSTSVSRDTAAAALDRPRGTCRSSPWGDAVQWSFLFLVLLWGCCISNAETLGRDHLMLWWFVRYKTIPLLKLMAANAHIMGTPGIASLASIPLQGELNQPPPVPRAALSSGRVSPQKRAGRSDGRWRTARSVFLRSRPERRGPFPFRADRDPAARYRGRARLTREPEDTNLYVVKLGETEQ